MPSPASVVTSPVLVAAPSTPYRQTLLTALGDTWPSLALTITANAAQLPDLIRQQAFALVVLDSALPGPPLPQLLNQLRSTRHQQPLLVLASGPLPLSYQQALQHYGTPALPCHADQSALLQAISPWLGALASGRLAHPIRLAGPPTPLSRRELDVLRLVVGDCSNQEIARQLSLSVRTVESHRRAMLQKAGVRSLIGLVVQAVREGWITN